MNNMFKTINDLKMSEQKKFDLDFNFSFGCLGHYTVLNPNILKKKNTHESLDSFVGLFNWFDFYKNSLEHGAGYSPVLFRIDKCQNKLSKSMLNFLKRKTAYNHLLLQEMKYISSRFIWKKIPPCKELFLSKFEDYISNSGELLLILLSLYDKKYKEFKDIVTKLSKQDSSTAKWLKSINTQLYMSLLIHLRNKIVHNPKQIKYSKLNEIARQYSAH